LNLTNNVIVNKYFSHKYKYQVEQVYQLHSLQHKILASSKTHRRKIISVITAWVNIGPPLGRPTGSLSTSFEDKIARLFGRIGSGPASWVG